MHVPLVSISCTSYNHENYIADAIESFLKQKTNFKFEILIHDDASTDRTAEIIKYYEELYPDLIKPIYQTENQYSKGICVEDSNLKRAKGKYIAVCEGDDYWLDSYKLQKQVDYMESHPECSLCVHGGHVVNASDKRIQHYNRPTKGSKFFTVEEVIEGGGGLFLTNSMFYRIEYSNDMPRFFEVAPVGDYPLAIHLSLVGSVYYIDEYMSAYRVGDRSSWTGKNFANVERTKRHYEKIFAMLDELNHYTNYQYEYSIEKRKSHDEMFMLFQQGNFKEIKHGKCKQLYKELHTKKKLILYLDQYIPLFSRFLRKHRRWLGGV